MTDIRLKYGVFSTGYDVLTEYEKNIEIKTHHRLFVLVKSFNTLEEAATEKKRLGENHIIIQIYE